MYRSNEGYSNDCHDRSNSRSRYSHQRGRYHYNHAPSGYRGSGGRRQRFSGQQHYQQHRGSQRDWVQPLRRNTGCWDQREETSKSPEQRNSVETRAVDSRNSSVTRNADYGHNSQVPARFQSTGRAENHYDHHRRPSRRVNNNHIERGVVRDETAAHVPRGRQIKYAKAQLMESILKAAPVDLDEFAVDVPTRELEKSFSKISLTEKGEEIDRRSTTSSDREVQTQISIDFHAQQPFKTTGESRESLEVTDAFIESTQIESSTTDTRINADYLSPVEANNNTSAINQPLPAPLMYPPSTALQYIPTYLQQVLVPSASESNGQPQGLTEGTLPINSLFSTHPGAAANSAFFLPQMMMQAAQQSTTLANNQQPYNYPLNLQAYYGQLQAQQQELVNQNPLALMNIANMLATTNRFPYTPVYPMAPSENIFQNNYDVTRNLQAVAASLYAQQVGMMDGQVAMLHGQPGGAEQQPPTVNNQQQQQQQTIATLMYQPPSNQGNNMNE